MLQRALESVAAQTLRPSEVFVVNDGDLNDLAGIPDLSRSLDLPMTIVSNNCGRGASGARNTGVAIASHSVIAFLDDDDEWLPQLLAEAIARVGERDLDVVCCDFVGVSADGDVVPGKSAPEQLSPDLFLTGNPGMIGSNLVIRKQCLQEIGGFDETLPSMNDMDLGLRISLHDGFRYEALHLPLVRHHHHGGVRLSIALTKPKADGVRQFYKIHSHRMNSAQRAEYRDRVIRLWGVDELGQRVASIEG